MHAITTHLRLIRRYFVCSHTSQSACQLFRLQTSQSVSMSAFRRQHSSITFRVCGFRRVPALLRASASRTMRSICSSVFRPFWFSITMCAFFCVTLSSADTWMFDGRQHVSIRQHRVSTRAWDKANPLAVGVERLPLRGRVWCSAMQRKICAFFCVTLMDVSIRQHRVSIRRHHVSITGLGFKVSGRTRP